MRFITEVNNNKMISLFNVSQCYFIRETFGFFFMNRFPKVLTCRQRDLTRHKFSKHNWILLISNDTSRKLHIVFITFNIFQTFNFSRLTTIRIPSRKSEKGLHWNPNLSWNEFGFRKPTLTFPKLQSWNRFKASY